VVDRKEHSTMTVATSVSRSAGITAGAATATALRGATSASAPFAVDGVVKIIYDPILWFLFRQVKPPEEACEP
jgi:hypothetical protein